MPFVPRPTYPYTETPPIDDVMPFFFVEELLLGVLNRDSTLVS